MGIASYKPEVEGPVTPYTPQTYKESYKGVVADNNQIPIVSMLQYVEGMPWKVVYYSQLVGEHNDLREVDPGQSAPYQQYQKIIDLELRVESPLASTFDEKNAITTVTGTAIVPNLIPNNLDYFVSDAGDRKWGLFLINGVERLTFNRESVYRVNYRLISYVSEESAEWTDLEKKSVRSYVFSKDRVMEGLSPFLKPDDHILVGQIQDHYQTIAEWYFSKFFNRTHSTLMVPGQSAPVYDAWLVKFLFSLVNQDASPLIKEIKVLSVDRDRYMAQPQLWSVLAERHYSRLNVANHKAVLVPRTSFVPSSFLRGTIYATADYYVYPVVRDLNTHIGGDPLPYTGSGQALIPTGQSMESIAMTAKNIYVNDKASYKLIKSVTVDDYYVLSEAFYEKKDDLSVLEILVKDYLKCNTLDLCMVNGLAAAYPNWPALEQFYYGPLLMLLMKEVTRGIYP